MKPGAPALPRVVLDTNVLISGIFFAGAPAKILNAWRNGRFVLFLSPEILDEYRRVAGELTIRFPAVDIAPVLDLVALHARVVAAPPLKAPLCRDRDDDKFLACAAACGAVLVSGDKDLLALAGSSDVEIITPRALVTRLAS